ncbi:MAG: ParB/RepB/Spo0J family partition protein [Phycisphaerae bacterium]
MTTAVAPAADTSQAAALTDAPSGITSIRVDAIAPNPLQPRSVFDDATLTELAESIRRQGILQPLLVRQIGSGKFELIAGERRLRAAKLAGLPTVPAIIRQVDKPESLEIALIENLQRADLNALERAAAYRHFLDTFEVSPEQLAARLGESRANVANYLRLLNLPEEVKVALQSNQIGMGQARAIAGIASVERQVAIARLAMRKNLSVRQVEALAAGDRGIPSNREEISARAKNRHTDDVSESLSRCIGLRVQLLPGKKKNSGRVVIRYDSLEEFDRIAEAIGGRSSLET